MEVTACAKTFILSVNQYKCNCSSEDAQSHLMRQIDVLTTITAKGSSLLFFESTEILQSECMTSIISLLNDYTIIKSTPLINKTLSLLSNLANSDIVKDCLRDTFDLPNILLNVFRSTLSSSDELSLSLCVRLLQKLTYKAALPYPVMKLNELLHYLLQQICQASPSGECMQPYLSLLSNLTHESQHVQMFIKSIDNLKAVLKKFMSFMSHTNQKMCISSIAILHNLKLDECIAGQIFTPSNVTQIFQLLFNILNNSKINKTNSAQHYAVDLFVDILHDPYLKKQLIEYKHLSTCLSLLINGLSMQNVHHFNVILELLINFSSETRLKEIIFKIIFDNPLCQSVSLDVESLVSTVKNYDMCAASSNNDHSHNCFLVVVICVLLSDDVDSHNANKNACMLSLQLLSTFLHEVNKTNIDNAPQLDTSNYNNSTKYNNNINSTNNNNQLEVMNMMRLDILIPVLSRLLNKLLSTKMLSSRKLIICLRILKSFCMNKTNMNQVKQQVNKDVCMNAVNEQLMATDENILAKNIMSLSISQNSTSHHQNTTNGVATSADASECSVHATLSLVHFLQMLFSNQAKVSNILKDRQLLPLITLGLMSSSSLSSSSSMKSAATSSSSSSSSSYELVWLSIKLLSSTVSLNPSNADILAQLLMSSNNNSNQQQPFTATNSANNLNYRKPLSNLLNASQSSSSLPSVQIATNFLNVENKVSNVSESSLDGVVAETVQRLKGLANFTDVKTAEVISLYEYKLQAFLTKEKMLQDLLDKKTEVINQSDCIISQFRTRLAEQETESRKLCLLLHDSERRNDGLTVTVSKMQAGIDELKNELDIMAAENTRLKEIEDMHKQLRLEHSDLLQKHESATRAMNNLLKEHQASIEKNEVMNKRYDSLKTELDIARQRLSALEEEQVNLTNQLKDREIKLSDLMKNLSKLDDANKKKKMECDELEVAVDKLRTELCKSEKINKDLAHQVSALELLCNQRESLLKEKESTIQQQKQALDKLAQFRAAIVNLSAEPSLGVSIGTGSIR